MVTLILGAYAITVALLAIYAPWLALVIVLVTLIAFYWAVISINAEFKREDRRRRW